MLPTPTKNGLLQKNSLQSAAQGESGWRSGWQWQKERDRRSCGNRPPILAAWAGTNQLPVMEAHLSRDQAIKACTAKTSVVMGPLGDDLAVIKQLRKEQTKRFAFTAGS
ncbi:unnamed protein product [Pleuronectes platessa]|uniref:Uncharacterized protein n=1 Tax=Pleuronectes platessa TaxID=8262 RepID=A0A9N7UWR3_PLEPL|nr:unnamed protein product [Pleuronectes platessa]